ncbi:hypothetical protein OHR68_29485 [Spirillospora sp. NBC_00431]
MTGDIAERVLGGKGRTGAHNGPAPSTLAIAAGLAGWLGVTVLSQHPERLFDGLRRYDPVGALIPNWRFFAPEPAQHDFHVLHRVMTADGASTEWRLTTQIADRSWKDWIWFPSRRQEKGLFDICSELITLMSMGEKDLAGTTGFQVLRNFVESVVRAERADEDPPRGFQFVIARYTGYAEDGDPEYLLVSAFVPLASSAPAHV